MTTGDFDPGSLPELDWGQQSRSESLTAVYTHAIDLARQAESWYQRRRPGKRNAGRSLRVLALLLGSAAVVLPVLSEIFTTGDKPAIAPGWAAVALALAAALVALDHFFGWSAAWMRYMTAGLHVARLRHEFEYRWNAARAHAEQPPTDTEVAAFIELAAGLVRDVDKVVADETEAWVTEFRGTLQRSAETLAAPAPGTPPLTR